MKIILKESSSTLPLEKSPSSLPISSYTDQKIYQIAHPSSTITTQATPVSFKTRSKKEGGFSTWPLKATKVCKQAIATLKKRHSKKWTFYSESIESKTNGPSLSSSTNQIEQHLFLPETAHLRHRLEVLLLKEGAFAAQTPDEHKDKVRNCFFLLEDYLQQQHVFNQTPQTIQLNQDFSLFKKDENRKIYLPIKQLNSGFFKDPPIKLALIAGKHFKSYAPELTLKVKMTLTDEYEIAIHHFLKDKIKHKTIDGTHLAVATSIFTEQLHAQDPVQTSILVNFSKSNLNQFFNDLNTRHIQLPWSTGCSIISQIADGLHELHQCQILHRDIKPDNILIDYEITEDEEVRILSVKITDFGCSRFQDESRIAELQKIKHKREDVDIKWPLDYVDPLLFDDTQASVITNSAALDVYQFGLLILFIFNLTTMEEFAHVRQEEVGSLMGLQSQTDKQQFLKTYKIWKENPQHWNLFTQLQLPDAVVKMLESLWTKDFVQRPSMKEIQKFFEKLVDDPYFKLQFSRRHASSDTFDTDDEDVYNEAPLLGGKMIDNKVYLFSPKDRDESNINRELDS